MNMSFSKFDESEDSIGELETFEDFANGWEEIESDDGHLKLLCYNVDIYSMEVTY